MIGQTGDETLLINPSAQLHWKNAQCQKVNVKSTANNIREEETIEFENSIEGLGLDHKYPENYDSDDDPYNSDTALDSECDIYIDMKPGKRRYLDMRYDYLKKKAVAAEAATKSSDEMDAKPSSDEQDAKPPSDDTDDLDVDVDDEYEVVEFE
jgi:hypothetical protein